jgi:hypothetical protein
MHRSTGGRRRGRRRGESLFFLYDTRVTNSFVDDTCVPRAQERPAKGAGGAPTPHSRCGGVPGAWPGRCGPCAGDGLHAFCKGPLKRRKQPSIRALTSIGTVSGGGGELGRACTALRTIPACVRVLVVDMDDVWRRVAPQVQKVVSRICAPWWAWRTPLTHAWAPRDFGAPRPRPRPLARLAQPAGARAPVKPGTSGWQGGEGQGMRANPLPHRPCCVRVISV